MSQATIARIERGLGDQYLKEYVEYLEARRSRHHRTAGGEQRAGVLRRRPFTYEQLDGGSRIPKKKLAARLHNLREETGVRWEVFGVAAIAKRGDLAIVRDLDDDVYGLWFLDPKTDDHELVVIEESAERGAVRLLRAFLDGRLPAEPLTE